MVDIVIGSFGLDDLAHYVRDLSSAEHRLDNQAGMDWKTVRGWWPYVLLGLTALGVVYLWVK